MSWMQRLKPEKPPRGTRGDGAFSSVREKPSLADRWAILLIYLCCLFGAVLVWMVEYDVPALQSALLGALIGAAVFGSCLFLPRGGAWVLACAALGVWGVAALWQRVQLVEGAWFAANLVYSRFTEVFDSFQTVPPPADEAGLAAFAVFLAMAAFALAALLALSALRLRSFLLTVMLCLPFFWFAFANTGLPPLLPSLLLICGWCGLLFHIRGKTAAAARVRVAAMGLVGVLVLGLLAAFPAGRYEQDKGVLQTRRELQSVNWENGLPGILRMGSGGRALGARTNTRVNLARTGDLQLGQGTAFQVRGMLVAMVSYYRGFSCSEYTGRAWRQGGAEGYEALEGGFQPLAEPYWRSFYQIMNERYVQLLYPEQEVVVDSDYQYAYAFEMRPQQVLAYAPAPYFINDAALVGGGDLAFVQDAHLSAVKREEIYRVSMPEFTQPEMVMEMEMPLLPLRMQYPGMMGDGSGLNNEMEDLVTVTITEDDLLTEEQRTYIEFIEEEYTQLPEGLAPRFQALAAGAGIQPAGGRDDWHATAYAVGNYIQGVGVYTRTPGTQPPGVDFAEYFLTQTKEGYCVHFATAAAVMLRALGVPARYVEGFVMPMSTQGVVADGDYAEDGKWLDVPSANAHAWVEVWEPGFGWVPLEVTPGGPDATRPPSAPQEPAGANSRLNDPGRSDTQAANSASISRGTSSSEADSSRGADAASRERQDGQPAGLRTLLWVVVIAVAVAAVLLLVPAALRARRRKRFAGADRRRAALEMYAYLLRLQRFGYTPGDETRALANKARFSRQGPSPGECGVLREETERARETLLRTLPPSGRLQLWLCGL